MISKKILMSTAATAFFVVGLNQQVMADKLESLTDRASYVFGYKTAERFKQGQIDINPEVFSQAMKDAQKGTEPKLSEEDMQDTMRALQTEQQAKQAEAMKEISEANEKEGKAFLAANAKKDGVKTTESGLQYKVLEAGKGAKPTRDNQVSVNYKGTLLDGTEFDSSYQRGEPATFGVTQVIPGWTEALLMMKEGAKWEVYIPSDLAYGAGGAGGQIGPNATLVFEIELLNANAGTATN
ncbi:FKBP-type peptidyl-prolyl cis-trans isomerase [Pseudomaricurvus sp.]|uniref:FKBP-type peptidyl-prolyl cis-trans isomerase n=1 Tax=Pseudomaricurvus sp. TaxID=2004510 RepID=UPI003F6BF634